MALVQVEEMVDQELVIHTPEAQSPTLAVVAEAPTVVQVLERVVVAMAVLV
jgi:hypothetical protein